MSSSFLLFNSLPRSRRGVLALAGGGLLLLGGGWLARSWKDGHAIVGDEWSGGVPTGRFYGEREVMGTRASIIVAHHDAAFAANALKQAMDAVTTVENRMSRFLPGSDVGRINREPGQWRAVHPDTERVLQRALAMARASDGRFDPCLEAPMALWGFFRHQPPARLPEAGELARLVARGAYRALEFRKDADGTPLFRLREPDADSRGVGIDLGGIAKGFGVDQATEVLQELGIEQAVVNVGDDLRVLGGAPEGGPWRIGVRHPRDPQAMLSVLELESCAVATSGDYANAFMRNGRRYAHLLDPATGQPARTHSSMTVQAPTAMDADALATAAFTTPPERVSALLDRLSGGPWLGMDSEGKLTQG